MTAAVDEAGAHPPAAGLDKASDEVVAGDEDDAGPFAPFSLGPPTHVFPLPSAGPVVPKSIPPNGGGRPPLRTNSAELPPPVGTSTTSNVALAPGALLPRPPRDDRRLSLDARERRLSTELRTRSMDDDDE